MSRKRKAPKKEQPTKRSKKRTKTLEVDEVMDQVMVEGIVKGAWKPKTRRELGARGLLVFKSGADWCACAGINDIEGYLAAREDDPESVPEYYPCDTKLPAAVRRFYQAQGHRMRPVYALQGYVIE